jgi:pyruvate dehydrogenase E2 component (dihydrolipoamide acetyltransferase)
MAVEITIPRLGWSMEEGVFSQWLKNDGDAVREGDALFELEGEKAVQQIESFDAGILNIPGNGPKPGDVVKVGQLIGYLCRKGEQAPSTTGPIAKSASAEATKELPAAAEPDGPQPVQPAAIVARENGTPIDRPVASPSVRRLARQMGVDVQTIQTSEVAGRITAEKVLAVGQNGNGKHSPAEAAEESMADSSVRVSPRAARTALKLGVNLLDVTATGSSGRIRECDVLAAAANGRKTKAVGPSTSNPRQLPEPAFSAQSQSGSVAAMSSLRRTIASRMLAASQQTAPVTLQSSADATEMVNIRRQFKAAANDEVRAPGFIDMLVKLSALALERHLALLGQWTEQGVLTPHGVHIAVAVDTPAGLLTPVLTDVPELSLSQISAKLHDLFQRTRSRSVSAEELQGGVFTISNLGGYRVDGFTPILNLPQTAILGVGRINPQPVVVEGRVEVRDRMALSLTFDHRVVDGAAAAAFLTTLCEYCESPLPHLLG